MTTVKISTELAKHAEINAEPVAWCQQSKLDWLNSHKRGTHAYIRSVLSKSKDALSQTALYTEEQLREEITRQQEPADKQNTGWIDLTDAEVEQILDTYAGSSATEYGGAFWDVAEKLSDALRAKNGTWVNQ